MSLAEARIAIESAAATADMLAKSEIGDALIIGQLLIFLADAVEALAKAEGDPQAQRPTVFPSPQAAAVMLDALPVSRSTAYRLHRGPDGKCEIEVFQMTGRL